MICFTEDEFVFCYSQESSTGRASEVFATILTRLIAALTRFPELLVYAYPCTTMTTSSDLETVDVSWITWVNCLFRMKAISSPSKLGSDTWHNIIYIHRKITSNHLLQLEIGENCSIQPFYHVGVTSACYVYQKIVILMIPHTNFEIFDDSTQYYWPI